jgi:hypothetical protein
MSSRRVRGAVGVRTRATGTGIQEPPASRTAMALVAAVPGSRARPSQPYGVKKLDRVARLDS